MALLDEERLQSHVIEILEVLRKDINCCKVVAAVWAASSLIAQGVFVTVDQHGGITVYDVPGGSVLTEAEYGVLTRP